MQIIVFFLCLLTVPAFTEPVVRIKVDSGITPVIAEYTENAIAFAKKQAAQLLLIELNTPGGLMDASRDMVASILGSPIPVVVYVSPKGARAGSAGVFIALSAHIAAMAPTTRIGAAHPVPLFGNDIEGEMGKKIENDTAAWAKSLAEQNRRNPLFAEKAVRESISLTAQEALKNKVIDQIADSTEALLRSLNGKKLYLDGKEIMLRLEHPTIQDFEMTGEQKLVDWFSEPNFLYLLMLIGFVLLFIEYQNPGMILPAALGLLMLAIVFGIQLLPINWLGGLFILLAVILLVAEIYITSFGILALGGIGLLVLGSYLLFDVPGSSLRIHPVVIWSIAITFGLLIIGFGILILKTQKQTPSSSIDAMVGETVEVIENISQKKTWPSTLTGLFLGCSIGCFH